MWNKEEIGLLIWIETEGYTVPQTRKRTFYRYEHINLVVFRISCDIVFNSNKNWHTCRIVSYTYVSSTANIT